MLANARSTRGGGGLLSRIGSGSGTAQRSAVAGMQHVRAGCTGNWLSHIDWDGARCRCRLSFIKLARYVQLFCIPLTL